MIRLLALCLTLGACSTTGPPPGEGAAAPPRPSDMRRCLPPVPPPPVPPAPRTVERLAQYAWAEARARWITADRLAQCSRQHEALREWIDRNGDAEP